MVAAGGSERRRLARAREELSRRVPTCGAVDDGAPRNAAGRLIGSDRARRRADQRTLQPAGGGAALSEVGVSTPAALLATWVMGRAGLERYAWNALPVTDDRPRIEYAAWLRRGEFQRVLPRVLEVRTDPPLLGADEKLRVAVAEESERLLEFYGAGLRAYAGERKEWASALEHVLKGDGENRYYRWFVGGGG